MKRLISAAIIAASLPACSVQAPIRGSFSDGQPVTGMAVATTEGGTVTVSDQTGKSCHGDYNPFSRAKELTIFLVCDDGITGTAQVSRSADGMSGDGTFKLSDGRIGNFDFQVE